MTKQEIKEVYKNIKKKQGIFKITNNKTRELYIGFSPDLEQKWNGQRFQLNSNTHPNKLLQKDWNELGEESFSFEIVDILKIQDENRNYKDDLKELEQFYITELKPYYNRK